MSSQVAEPKDEASPGMTPELVKASLATIQRLSRYHWLAPLCVDRTVLDAGCGMGDGCIVLASAGAAGVTGLTTATSVVEAARMSMPQTVTLDVADLDRLPFADESFDVVVCFDLGDHLRQPAVVIDELFRVRTRGGLLALAWPHREVPLPGDAEHRRLFRPSDVEAMLKERFPAVHMFHQAHWIASAIMPKHLWADDTHRPSDIPVRGMTWTPTSEPSFVVALAADSLAGDPPPIAVLGEPAEAHQWLARFSQQQAALTALHQRIDELERVKAERNELRKQLRYLEQSHWVAAMDQLGGLQAELGLIKSSTSWRMTAPLRRATSLLRRFLRRPSS